MRHVFHTMGTVASIELPGYVGADSVMATIEFVFSDAEERFSLYRDDSELARVNAGSLPLTDASLDLRHAYEKAMEWRALTDGAFTPNRPDGALDLNGIAKAWTMATAGRTLLAAGMGNWSLDVGGDVLCSGTQTDDAPWTIGVSDPVNRSSLLCAITLADGRNAVATSGSAERGDHIWLGGDRHVAEFVQVTVAADDIVTADVLATAIVSGGQLSLDEITAKWSVDVMTVDRDGQLRATAGFRAALAA